MSRQETLRLALILHARLSRGKLLGALCPWRLLASYDAAIFWAALLSLIGLLVCGSARLSLGQGLLGALMVGPRGVS